MSNGNDKIVALFGPVDAEQRLGQRLFDVLEKTEDLTPMQIIGVFETVKLALAKALMSDDEEG